MSRRPNTPVDQYAVSEVVADDAHTTPVLPMTSEDMMRDTPALRRNVAKLDPIGRAVVKNEDDIVEFNIDKDGAASSSSIYAGSADESV